MSASIAHAITCPSITTIRSLGTGLDNVVTSATIQISTSKDVTYTETVTETQMPQETGTAEETYQKTQYTKSLAPMSDELSEVTEGTEVFRKALPKVKIGDVVTLTREVPTYDIPEPVVTTSNVERTKTFSSDAEFIVEFGVDELSTESFVSYDSLTEATVIGWARALVPDTFTEAETKNATRVELSADMFENPDKYVTEHPVPPWRLAEESSEEESAE